MRKINNHANENEKKRAEYALTAARIFSGHLMQYAEMFESGKIDLPEFSSYIGMVSYQLGKAKEIIDGEEVQN